MEKRHEDEEAATKADTRKHVGSCHCGAVRFEVAVDVSAGASRCNCSVCTKIAATVSMVKPGAFALVAGEESLSAYEWGAKIARRFFCRRCGVHCFARGHLAELGGDFVSVNLNCLDDIDPNQVKVVYWDGRHNNQKAGPSTTPWPIQAPSSPRA
ncbi:MAG TPA: GFA family protein [Polyangia bacterium]|nr:GFA family protein [Polyangia bacterium]